MLLCIREGTEYAHNSVYFVMHLLRDSESEKISRSADWV
jgi:hypothetical protein